jgi:UDP-N-acetylmuramate--alanine ligase
MAAAKSAKIKLQRRAVFLSELMKDMTVITITGAHGKTTTSSLAAKLLMQAGLHPTMAIGGILREDGENAMLGEGRYFVAEADESDGTFLCYTPTYSIITNIDHEHLDFYKTFDGLLEAFTKFVGQTKKDGCVFYFNEDPALKAIVARSKVRAVSFGFSEQADFYPKSVLLSQCRLKFTCMKKDKALGEIATGLMGRHNVLNCLAVIALGCELGLDCDRIKKALSGFRGVERRFQVRHEDKDILIVDDYGHHPTEIAATISAAKLCRRARLVVVFQPHRYSRTQMLMDQFAKSFVESDHLIVTDIYAAGEEPIGGVTAELLVARIQEKSRVPVAYVPKEKVIEHLGTVVLNNDLVLFLGAGDITKIADEFAKKYQQ